MTDVVEKKLKIFIRDLFTVEDTQQVPEAQIKGGRDNAMQKDFETLYVVVDALAPSERVSGSLSYDGENEVQTISNNYKTNYTIDFYGDDAYDKANEFVLLARSQKAYELKKSLGIGIFQVSSIQDIKKLTGQQYGNRYQVTMKVEDCRSVDVDTLRIDEAQISVITD